MMKKKTSIFGVLKAIIAINALKKRESLAKLAKRYEVHSKMISKRKQEFLDHYWEIFEKKSEKAAEVNIEKFYAKICQLEIENELKKLEENRTVSELRELVEKNHFSSIRKIWGLLSVQGVACNIPH